jgi:hypothetical protein
MPISSERNYEAGGETKHQGQPSQIDPPLPKRPVISEVCCKPVRETFLIRILRRCGAYYHSGDLFYQELWKQRLGQIGFRVLSVEKLPLHHVWDIRVCGSLTAQTYLLLSKPVPSKHSWVKDPLPKQLQSEIHEIARDLGLPIRRDCILVVRTGAYFGASFIWPLGKPGRLLKKAKRAEAFSFLIRPWLRKNRN